MARQPFQPMHIGKHTEVGPASVRGNPRLAQLIGICANAWSHVDLQLALAFGSMLGIENPASVAAFVALRNARAQRDALQAAADVALKGELADLFAAIMSLHKELDGQRNDVVHGIWGTSKDIPDAAIWQSTQAHATMLVEVYHSETVADGANKLGPRGHHMTKGYSVHHYRDIEALNESIDALSHAIGHFHAHLRYRDLIPVVGANALRSLKRLPLVQKALAEMKSSREKRGQA